MIEERVSEKRGGERRGEERRRRERGRGEGKRKEYCSLLFANCLALCQIIIIIMIALPTALTSVGTAATP